MKVTAKDIPCDCGDRAIRQLAIVTFKITVDEIREKVPAFVCQKCGEVYYDGPSLVKIEKDLR